MERYQTHILTRIMSMGVATIQLGGVTSPSLKKKSRLDPPTFAIKILVHDWSTSPAFFPLLRNQIRCTLSVCGIPIAIEIHSAFSWYPTHLITHQIQLPYSLIRASH